MENFGGARENNLSDGNTHLSPPPASSAVKCEGRESAIYRRSVSLMDVSRMRLHGCRVAVRPSALQQRSWDTSVSFSAQIPVASSLGSSYGKVGMRRLTEVDGQRGTHPAPNEGEHDKNRVTVRNGDDLNICRSNTLNIPDNRHAEDANVDDEDDEDEDDVLSGIEYSTGTAPPLRLQMDGTVTSASQQSSSQSTAVVLSAFIDPNGVTELEQGSSTCNTENRPRLVQPFSTWKFPVLGSVDAATSGAFPPSNVTEKEGGVRKLQPVVADANKEPPCVVNVPGADGTFSSSDPFLSPRYMKQLALVYATYEAFAATDNSTLDTSERLTRRQSPQQTSLPRPQSTSTLSMNAGPPRRYYSLGSRRSMHHANKHLIPVVPRCLDNLSSGNSGDHRSIPTPTQSMMIQRHQMDSAILSHIEHRPLLQITLFLEFVYGSIKRQAVRHLSIDKEHKRDFSRRISADTTDKTLKKTEAATANVVATTKVVRVATAFSKNKTKSTFAATAGTTVAETGAEIGAGTACSPTAPSFEIAAGMEPSTASASTWQQRRHLTEVHSWNKKVHSVDGIARCVDNEEDDLVVYVGMILMGWLEVVDLLGAGTFGQVFLCKDLRVSGPQFTHPNMIEGEDFQYWQCSHEYIPFSDPSIPPANQPLVAVKVVKSRELFEQQSVLEAEMLVFIGAQTASNADGGSEAAFMNESAIDHSNPPVSDPRCRYVAKIFAHGVCYGHHCIVIERYGANLFEYVQSRNFKGLPMYHIQELGRQILLSLTLLHNKCHLVHCDIKPENVLLTLHSCLSSAAVRPVSAAASTRSPFTAAASLAAAQESASIVIGEAMRRGRSGSRQAGESLSSSLLFPAPRRMHSTDGATAATMAAVVPLLEVKIIDFSSSAYMGGCTYTYVQSRYYRAPEVILGVEYGPPIDLWSTGCLLAELLLGLPLLPGSSDYHQLCLMEEMLGSLPACLITQGKQSSQFYTKKSDEGAHGEGETGQFQLMLEDDYMEKTGSPPIEWQRYFQYRSLTELVRKCILTTEERRIAVGRNPYAPDTNEGTAEQAQNPIKEILDEMMRQRFWLFDLLRKMLQFDPNQRITAAEALKHPFFTQLPRYMEPYLQTSK